MYTGSIMIAYRKLTNKCGSTLSVALLIAATNDHKTHLQNAWETTVTIATVTFFLGNSSLNIM